MVAKLATYASWLPLTASLSVCARQVIKMGVNMFQSVYTRMCIFYCIECFIFTELNIFLQILPRINSIRNAGVKITDIKFRLIMEFPTWKPKGYFHFYARVKKINLYTHINNFLPCLILFYKRFEINMMHIIMLYLHPTLIAGKWNILFLLHSIAWVNLMFYLLF